MFEQEDLKSFGGAIQRLIQGEHLSREECYGLFCQILNNRQPDLQQGAFLAALVAKGETPEEIAGAWQAIDELDTVHAQMKLTEPLVENSGTGMDQLKTFNVSSAAAIVAAAGGVRVARHGARALTSVCGAVDILEALGIEVEGDVPLVARSIEQAGIGLFNGMSPEVHPRALGRILSQIRFGSTLNIAASLAHPCRPTHALRGVYAVELLPKVAAVMQEIGYRRGMVVHGFDARREKGMDELSVLGASRIYDFFPDGTFREYDLQPEEFGITRVPYEYIAPLQDREREAVRFLQVLAGAGHQACIDFVCLNAGAVLYVAGRVGTLAEGVRHSHDLIGAGQALKKLTDWVAVQQGPERKGIRRLEQLVKAADLKIH
ncbi:MAG: anthranilate phosphoribosyltransferase [Deltaproteobacteria bacterium]|nr:anthranilate phosphoribosyltransferase [Deltaproteobacteria bacterium]